MEYDFDLVARDFLNEEYENLKKYCSQMYVNDNPRYCSPEESIRYKVLNLMYNAAKEGNEFAVDMFKLLFKLYYKSEYKQLKRFSKLSPDEAMSLSGDFDDLDYSFKLSRTLAMARLYGVEISKYCALLYETLNEKWSLYENGEDEEREYAVLIEEEFGRAKEHIEELIGKHGAVDWYDPLSKQFKTYNRARDFLGQVFRHQGFPDAYLEMIADYTNPQASATRTYAMLKNLFPKKEFSAEEIQYYTVLCECGTVLCHVLTDQNYQLDTILGISDDLLDEEDSLYKTGMVKSRKGEAAAKAIPEKKAQVKNKLSVDAIPDDEDKTLEAMKVEVDELRQKLHSSEGKVKKLQELYNQGKNQLRDLEFDRKQHDIEHKELIAMREHLYRLSEEDIESESELPEEEMIKVISDKRVLIIGGHINWINKLKGRFPLWTFLNPGSNNTITSELVRNVDKAYFFTDTIDHTTYYKFMNVVQRSDTPFGYIHSVNIRANIRQIYEDFAER